MPERSLPPEILDLIRQDRSRGGDRFANTLNMTPGATANRAMRGLGEVQSEPPPDYLPATGGMPPVPQPGEAGAPPHSGPGMGYRHPSGRSGPIRPAQPLPPSGGTSAVPPPRGGSQFDLSPEAIAARGQQGRDALAGLAGNLPPEPTPSPHETQPIRQRDEYDDRAAQIGEILPRAGAAIGDAAGRATDWTQDALRQGAQDFADVGGVYAGIGENMAGGAAAALGAQDFGADAMRRAAGREQEIAARRAPGAAGASAAPTPPGLAADAPLGFGPDTSPPPPPDSGDPDLTFGLDPADPMAPFDSPPTEVAPEANWPVAPESRALPAQSGRGGGGGQAGLAEGRNTIRPDTVDPETGTRPDEARADSLIERIFGEKGSPEYQNAGKALMMAGATIMSTGGSLGEAIGAGIQSGLVTYDEAMGALAEEQRDAKMMGMREEAHELDMELKRLQAQSQRQSMALRSAKASREAESGPKMPSKLEDYYRALMIMGERMPEDPDTRQAIAQRSAGINLPRDDDIFQLGR